MSNSLHNQSSHLLIFSDVSNQNAHCANLFLSGYGGVGARHVVKSQQLSKLLPFHEVSADASIPGMGGLEAGQEGQGGSSSPH